MLEGSDLVYKSRRDADRKKNGNTSDVGRIKQPEEGNKKCVSGNFVFLSSLIWKCIPM